MYVGVDGFTGGWVAVAYGDTGSVEAASVESIAGVWEWCGETARCILIDIPIGLQEASNEPRECDTLARQRLSPRRHASVFPPPVRPAVYEASYEQAKARQEALTDGSLGVQAWGIAGKIAEVDRFLREHEPNATRIVREAHPEVCFWALNNQTPTAHSKTRQPERAFRERANILERIDPAVRNHLETARRDLDTRVGRDDIADAFALALTASPNTGPLQTLPNHPPTDPHGLPMEMVYAHPRDTV